MTTTPPTTTPSLYCFFQVRPVPVVHQLRIPHSTHRLAKSHPTTPTHVHVLSASTVVVEARLLEQAGLSISDVVNTRKSSYQTRAGHVARVILSRVALEQTRLPSLIPLPLPPPPGDINTPTTDVLDVDILPKTGKSYTKREEGSSTYGMMGMP